MESGLRDLNRARWMFVTTFLIGWAFFLLPVPFGDKYTVPFDVLISLLRTHFPGISRWYTMGLILAGAIFTLLAARKQNPNTRWMWLREFRTSSPILLLRLLGMLLTAMFFLDWVPSPWRAAGVDRLIWNTLSVSVALIIPIGALVVQLFVVYGGLEFIGVLAQPLMRPLFRLPGRAALDALASWVGSYSVGLYITRTVYRQGGYSKKHVFIIATCFSTVSMGFVGVVAATLDLLHLFPLIIGMYFCCIVLLTIILVRMPPIRNVPNIYVDTAHVKQEEKTFSGENIWRRAMHAAVEKARQAPSLTVSMSRAFGDGLVLAASILGTIVAVGTLSLLIAKFTPVFEYLGRPLIPILNILGVPETERVASAILIEITEMYIPALLVVESSEAVRFFIAVLSVSQLIFFSSLGPMIMDMFRDIPIRFRDLIILFFLRTIILIPLLWGSVEIFVYLGWLSN